jgi:hypothetical protein
MDSLGYDMNAYAAQQPPQIFGTYHDGSPMAPMPYQGAYFGDGTDAGLDDNDPKRRRIARVRLAGSRSLKYADNRISTGLRYVRFTTHLLSLLLTCCAGVGKRRSNVMASCPNVRIAPTTKQNASLRKWRRREILPKGMDISYDSSYAR